MLRALGNRADRPQRRPRSLAARSIASPAEAFHLYRQDRAQRARTLNALLIPLNDDYTIPLRRAPDIRQACVVKHYPKKHQFMDYLTCRAADYKSPLWETCTGKNGIDAAVIKKCYETEGKSLLKDSFKFSGSLGIEGSPTFLANNRYTFGGIDAETIKSNFCNYNKGLAACAKTLSHGDGRTQGSCGQ